MIIEIKNEELAKILKEIAYKEEINVDKLVEDLLTFSLDHSISTLALKRIEFLLVNEIMPSLANNQLNTLAARHQITNMHADILESEERAFAIAKEATDLAYKSIFEEEGEEKDENIS
jgi:hypothetical protein